MAGSLRITAIALLLISATGACGDPEPPPPPPPASVGSARITWEIQDQTGAAVDCLELNLVDASVALGGTPIVVACGDEQTATFTGLIVDRYPLVIQLRGFGGGVVLDKLDNVVLMPDQTVEHHVVLEVNRTEIGTGKLEFTWQVAGIEAAQGCALVGAETIRLQTRPGSITDFVETFPCSAGIAEIDLLRSGLYTVRATLEDVAGNTLEESGRQVDVEVRQAETNEIFLSFFLSSNTATFVGSWTVTGSAAEDACEAADAFGVRVRLLNEDLQGVEIATGTIACEVGELTLEELPPGFGGVRATFSLLDFFGAPIASESVRNLLLAESRTTTAAVDFQPTE